MGDSSSSLSSSSQDPVYSVSLDISDIDTYVEGRTEGYYVKITVISAIGLEKEIFVFQRKSGAATSGGTNYHDDFSNVASPADIEEYSVDEPASDQSFFRKDTVELVVRSLPLLQQVITDIKADICSLLETLRQMASVSSQTVIIDDTCSTLGSPDCPSIPALTRVVAAGSNPTVNDDAAHGYGVGSIWTNTSTGQPFVLIDNTTGAAVWQVFGLDISAHNQIPHRDVYPAHPLTAIQVDVESDTHGVLNPNDLTAAERNTVFTNEGIGALNYQQLPAAVAGISYTFIVYETAGIRIIAAAGDIIQLGSAQSIAGGYVESDIPGSTLQLIAINNTTWAASLALGSWEIEV